MENSFLREDGFSIYSLKDEMNKSGYTDIATSVAYKTLTKMDMVETFKECDEFSGVEYNACRLTIKGDDWILSNQDQLQFQLSKDLVNPPDFDF